MHAEDLHLLTVHGLPSALCEQAPELDVVVAACLSPGRGEMGAAHREQMGRGLEHPILEQSCGRTSF